MTQKDKTLVFVNSAKKNSYGGGEKWYFLMLKAFSNQGYEVHLICRPNSKLMKACEQLNIPISPLNFGSDFSLFTIIKSYLLLKKIAPDVVFLNFNKDVSTVGIAAKLLRINKTIFINGLALIKKKRKHRFLTCFYDKIVSNTEHLKKHYKSFGWGLEKKVEVVYNGIELLESKKTIPTKKERNEVTIVGAGRLNKVKRFGVFIDLISRLKENGFPVKGIIAGDGQERASLQQQAIEKNTPVTFIGHVQSIRELLQEGDVFLHTSTHEGMPTVLIEAMSQKTICVATDVGGTNELIRHQENGYLNDAHDIDGLYESLVKALPTNQQNEILIEQAYLDYCKMFDLQTSINKIEALF